MGIVGQGWHKAQHTIQENKVGHFLKTKI